MRCAEALTLAACLWDWFASHLDTSISMLQEAALVPEGTNMSADGKTLLKDGVSYQVGDQVYVHPETFDQLEQAAQAEVPDYAAKGRFHKVRGNPVIPVLPLSCYPFTCLWHTCWVLVISSMLLMCCLLCFILSHMTCSSVSGICSIVTSDD